MTFFFFLNYFVTRCLKCSPGSLSEMAVLGVWFDRLAIDCRVVDKNFIYSLNMVLAGKDLMFCLSGKLRFVTFWRTDFERIINFSSLEIFSTALK